MCACVCVYSVGVTRISGNRCSASTAASIMALVHVHDTMPHDNILSAQVSVRSVLKNPHEVVMHYCRYVTLPVGSMGVYDPTEIRNRGMLTKFQKESFIKIAYHLITFFISLYG